MLRSIGKQSRESVESVPSTVLSRRRFLAASRLAKADHGILRGVFVAKLQARAWLSRALCAPGQHTAKRRRKCTGQTRFCLYCQIFTYLKKIH